MSAACAIRGASALLVVACLVGSSGCGREEEREHGFYGRREAQLEILCRALQLYEEDYGFMPPARVGLRALIAPRDESASRGVGTPYVKESILYDPWGKEIEYSPPVADKPATLTSHGGSDGREGHSIQCRGGIEPKPPTG